MIDCHLHLQNLRFEGHLPEIMDAVRKAGIQKLLVNGTSPEDWPRVAGLADEYEEVVPFFGLHPWRVNGVRDGWKNDLVAYLDRYPNGGVGEIGLDRWIRDHDLDAQREAFLYQLSIASEWDRPVAVHCLQAWGSLKECLDQSGISRPFLLHSFSGPVEMVDGFVFLGAYFSISGYFFREEKSEKLTAFESVPPDRILLETDAPDMLPPAGLISIPLESVFGDELNHPANLASIYRAYAEWSGLTIGEAVERIETNFSNWFRGKQSDVR